MAKTVTFTDGAGRFQYTVKAEFCKKNPDYSSLSAYELSANRKITNYLHNEEGPALIFLETQIMYYFRDGRKLDEKEIHTLKFYNEMTGILNDD